MSKRVLVVGDVIIDEYVYTRRRGLSAETPTIVVSHESTKKFVGGAGLVARHLLRLGCEVWMYSIGPSSDFILNEIGGSDDLPTSEEFDRFYDITVGDHGWIVSKKTRYFCENYKLLQIDSINTCVVPSKSTLDEMESGRAFGDASYDAIVICDNRHGVMSYTRHYLMSFAKKQNIPVYVDSQVSQNDSNLDLYHGSSYVLVNERELESWWIDYCFRTEFSGDREDVDPTLKLRFLEKEISYSHRKSCQAILKMGERGCATLGPGKLEIVNYPAFPAKVVDTCGAGDAFLAAFVTYGDLNEANRWASLTTEHVGTIVPKKD